MPFLSCSSLLAHFWPVPGIAIANQPERPASEARRVLYYVDPMNPSHTSDKPGLAPCGMKMEPVYADDGSGADLRKYQFLHAPGTVKISPEKQQIIGVQDRPGGKDLRYSHTLRTLGRVAPDETRIYRINSATDGWVKKIFPVTTGSLVKKDELLATFLPPGVLLGDAGLSLWPAIAGPVREERQGDQRAARADRCKHRELPERPPQPGDDRASDG